MAEYHSFVLRTTGSVEVPFSLLESKPMMLLTVQTIDRLLLLLLVRIRQSD
jgi:hypothetical protein